jgi:hypothetical protein
MHGMEKLSHRPRKEFIDLQLEAEILSLSLSEI